MADSNAQRTDLTESGWCIMERWKRLTWIGRLGKGAIALIYGLPTLWVEKEHAKATSERINCWRQFLELLHDAGFSRKERKRLLLAAVMGKGGSEEHKDSASAEGKLVKLGKMSDEVKGLRLAVAKLELLVKVPAEKRDSVWAEAVCAAGRLIRIDVWRLCPERKYLTETVVPILKKATGELLSSHNHRSI